MQLPCNWAASQQGLFGGIYAVGQQRSQCRCIVPSTTAPGSLAQCQTTQSSNLAQAGSCRIVLGGGVGSSLPCSQVSQYTRILTAVCSDSSLTTGPVLYPDGFQSASSTFIALTTSTAALPQMHLCHATAVFQLCCSVS